MKAIIIDKIGGPKVLKVKNIDAPKKFKKHDVLVRQTYAGVNFFDVCYRKGQYSLDKFPNILGLEGVGVIEAVGSGVKEFAVGERVAYGTGSIGSYQEKRIIEKRHLVVVPDGISDKIAAAVMTKGLMAHSLLFRAYQVGRAKKVLVHSAAGGVGQFLCQWAKHLGVEVIGVVGSKEKINIALENGCRYVINSSVGNFYEEVKKITKNLGVGAVYDGVGKDTLENSLKCLWPMGVCMSYGESSGKTEKLDLNHLVKHSLYLTRPTLSIYKANRVELSLAANDIFDLILRGALRPRITEYSFTDVAKAHYDLESRKSVGSIVLKF